MTHIPNGLPGSSQALFASTDRIRIAQLALGQPAEPEDSSHIEAVVSLVWPYSNKNKSLSLLLVEPDVRLRSAKGQVKVTFQGTAAQQIAKSQLGIGDIVLLRIDHAEWIDTGDAVETPGKKVQWDLHFKNRVLLEAKRGGIYLTTIDYEGSDTPPPVLDVPPHRTTQSHQVNGFHDNTSIAFSTPISGRSKRTSSGSFIDASLDPFADDDGFVLGKGRKRTKFGRTSGSWRLLGEGETSDYEKDLEATPEEAVAQISEEYLPRSPAKSNGLQGVIFLDDESSPGTSPVEASMPPLLAPFRRPIERVREASPQTERLLSPRLRPLASPGLPMVSPLVKVAGGSVGYFDVQSTVPSELDAISVSLASLQEGVVANNPAGEQNMNVGLHEHRERSPKSAERIPSTTQPDTHSKVVEILPPISSLDRLEVETSAFDNLAAASPFGVTPSGFSGSISQPKSAFSTTDFGASSAPSPFAITSNSSSFAANFLSFGNSSTFSIPRGNRTGAGFGFATPIADTSTKPNATSHSLEASQEVTSNDMQKHSPQEMEAAVDEHRAKRSVVQVDVEPPRRERELSEDDDDMYGSARPTGRTPSLRSVASGGSESISRNGEELLEVTMFDLDAEKVPPVAFSSSKDWNNMTQTNRCRFQQSHFLDGASDEMSEYEASEDATAAKALSEGPSTPKSSESLELVQSVETRDLNVVDLVPLTTVEDAAMFESVTRAQIALGPILELQGRTVLQTQVEKRPDIQTTDNDDNLGDLTTGEPELELEEVGAKQTAEQNLMSGPKTEEDVPGLDGDEANTKPEQLLTPENTQRDFPEGHSFDSLQQVPSLQMPPTPDNTQEPVNVDVSQLDGPSESQPLEQRQASAELSLPAPPQSQNVKSGPSRKALNVPPSPYFTPRISARLSPERQTKDVESKEPDEEVDRAEAAEQPAEDHPIGDADETAILSRRHDKHLHNILGMTTPLSYYTPLPNLDEHYGQQIDLLAICTADSGVPARSKAGPKDYSVTLHLTDSFLDGAATVTAQLFRPYKSALPSVQRGEAILLRLIKVQSQRRKMMLLSTDSSAWAVFSFFDVSPKEAKYWDLQVHVAGPPVEYGSEEYVYAKRLMEWWETDGRLAHKAMSPKAGDPSTRPRTRDGPDMANTTGDRSELVTKGTTNGLVDAYKSQSIDARRTERSSRRNRNNTNKMENDDQTREQSTPRSPTFQRNRNNTDNMENDDQTREQSAPWSPAIQPASQTPARTTRSSRRVANRTDNTGSEEDPATADTIEPLPEITSPKTGRRARRSTYTSETPELSRSLRSQSAVHELRDGTKYVDGHVPMKKDGVHVLRDGTKYVDENVSPAGKESSVRAGSVVHELRDGTNYVDRSTSPEVRRSARNKRGSSLVHELRDGAKYTDE
jgi:hypothetical protein